MLEAENTRRFRERRAGPVRRKRNAQAVRERGPVPGTAGTVYLLEEDVEDCGAYGVQVELKGEEASVRDLSPSRQRVLELTETLARGAVTPAALRDVVDDWLLE